MAREHRSRLTRRGAALLGGLSLLAGLGGCGGTNTIDSTPPYNRASGDGRSPQLPAAGNAAGESVAVLSAKGLTKKEQVDKVVESIRKLPASPRHLLLYDLTEESAAVWSTSLGASKIKGVPIYSGNAAGWPKVLGKLGATKLYGNGPKLGGANVDALTKDESRLSSFMQLGGLHVVVVNTDTSNPASKPGAIPKMWLARHLETTKARHVILVGHRPMIALEESDRPNVVMTNPEGYLGKSKSVRAFVGNLSDSPRLARGGDSSIFQMLIPAKGGEPPVIGLISIRPDGPISAQLIDLTAAQKPIFTAVLYEPGPGNKAALDAAPGQDPSKLAAPGTESAPTNPAPSSKAGGTSR